MRGSLVQLVRVSSHRRPEDDLSASRWTPYGQLMKSVLESSAQYQDLKKLLSEINGKVSEAFAEQKAALLSGAQVVSYVDDIDFQLTKANNPVELLRNLQIMVSEDGRQIELDRLGSGTQSAVIIGLLELVLRAKSGRSKILAIEEPDVFIHPHGIRHLASLIRGISGDAQSQVVLSTHSPSLLAILTPGDIVRVEKEAGHSVVHQSPGTLSDPVFARFINQDNAEMFFAKRVVLVEGPTERFLLPPLSKMITSDLTTLDYDRLRYSIVELAGKTSLLNYLRILDEFSIDTRAILDRDFLGDQTCSKLVEYLRRRGMAIDDSNSRALQESLWSAGIMVLPKGEIENYIPEADAAAVSGKSLAEVQAALGASSKASDAFRKLFGGIGKPLYARQLADYYTGTETVPKDLEDLIITAAA
jgi:putative ATP-dependent endonuclease of OLD family